MAPRSQENLVSTGVMRGKQKGDRQTCKGEVSFRVSGMTPQSLDLDLERQGDRCHGVQRELADQSLSLPQSATDGGGLGQATSGKLRTPAGKLDDCTHCKRDGMMMMLQRMEVLLPVMGTGWRTALQ